MTSKTAFFRLIAAVGFVAFMSMGPQAGALEPSPDDAQLQKPGVALAATPAQAAAAPTLETNTAAQQPQTATADAAGKMPNQPNAVKNDAPGKADPCPTPDAVSNTPDDLAKVQEDIDRFSLCVQRAQLLERLNESILKNQEADDNAMGLRVPGLAGAQRAGNTTGLPPLPANALAGADVTPLAEARAPSAPKQAPAATETSAPATAAAAAPAEPTNPWTIREIYGSGAGVEAKLVSPEGDEFKARTGAKLPDGKTTVVRVTPTGVTVKDDKGVKPLDWTKI